MAIITLPPRFSFSDVSSFRLVRASSEIRGKYSGWRQLITWPYALWFVEATLTEVDGADAAKLRSFLVQLKGKQNKFRLPVPAYFGPRSGYAGANPTVRTAQASRANSLNLTGFAVGASILDGDYFVVNDELKMVIGDYTATGQGRIDGLTFEPALRFPATATTAVNFSNPTVFMSAQNDDVANWGLKAPRRQSGKVKFIEALELNP